MHLSLSDVDRFEGGSKVHLHCFLTRKDSITARVGYPGLVKNCLSTSLTQWMRASERAHCSMIPCASSIVRASRNRSCGDSLLVKASKIPRESVMTIPRTRRIASSRCQRYIGASCCSEHAICVNHRSSFSERKSLTAVVNTKIRSHHFW